VRAKPIHFALASLLLVVGAAAASAQETDPAGGEVVQAPAEEGPSLEETSSQIDEILAGEEEVLAGASYSYDPGNRRDPFKSLIVGKLRPERKGPVPEGAAGLFIDEIDLTGIFKTSRGFVAQVIASNKEKSYLIREGDQLYDGDVVSITQNEVVFKQIVNDPTVIKPFREVVKKLSP